MKTNHVSFNLENCEKDLIEPNNLAILLENTFYELGGNNKAFPYLFKMTNTLPSRDFVSGGIMSEKLGVLLDYIPLNNSMEITVLSSREISRENLIEYLKNKLPKCSINVDP